MTVFRRYAHLKKKGFDHRRRQAQDIKFVLLLESYCWQDASRQHIPGRESSSFISFDLIGADFSRISAVL